MKSFQKCAIGCIREKEVCVSGLARRRECKRTPRFFACTTAAFWWLALGYAQSAERLSVASNGWTVSADGAQEIVTIAHDGLGPLAQDVRLNLRGPHGNRPAHGWTVEQGGLGRLVVKTVHPRTAWEFVLRQNELKISSNSYEGLLTAVAPASTQRIVARLLDPQGTPVSWVGTAEVANRGGSETIHQSFLPRRNPECMYFTLGLVASPSFHSLFDRPTDTAIDFSEGTLLKRAPRNPELLDLQMPVEGNAMIRIIPDYFTGTLGLPYYVLFDDSYFRRAPMVWSSWTSYYNDVAEGDIIRNTDWLAAHLRPYGFEYVVLDDGYDRDQHGQHYWIENWDREKFPHGPEWLASYIKGKGLRPGLWLVPNAYAGATADHPDWYLQDRQGNRILDYATPALDSTNPEALAFVKHLFDTLDGWGFEYYKFDGEYALPRFIPGVDTSKLHDPTLDALDNYRQRLKMVREALGPRRFIEGCPSGTSLNGIGFFNSYFNGHDLYANWQGMHPLFSSINANAFLNRLTVYVMPGEGLELGLPMTVEEAAQKRPPSFVAMVRRREQPLIGFGVTAAEARTLVTYVALTGVAYPLASVMPELPEERVKLLTATMPTMPILPVDLFSRGTDMRWDTFKHTQADYYIHNYPEILDLKVNAAAGVYDVTGFTNWRNERAAREIDVVEKLGLARATSYIAFDFWNQKLLGVFRNHLRLEIEPHDTRVLLLHPAVGRPQLIANSRHISGAWSVHDVSWDAKTQRLSGTADTVAGDLYRLWIYVPQGSAVSQVSATAGSKTPISVLHKVAGNSLMVSFPGGQSAVMWSVGFAAASKR